MKSVPDRLKSRKFWAFVGAFISFMAVGEYQLALGAVLGYLGMQGVQDAVVGNAEARQGNVNASTEVVIEDDPYDGSIVSGKE